jgi:serine/threonine-protein kinase
MTGVLHKQGDVVGQRYKIERYIGAGGMQEVYLAFDRLLERHVALKVPKTPSAAKRFKRSAVVSAKINHANVAKTLDYLEVGDRSYLIEEFVDGEDLGAVLKQQPSIFDPYLAAQVFHRLALGLRASHHAGVIHRDLKPSNIMVVGGQAMSDVKITDFGIAKMALEEIAGAVDSEANLTQSSTALGALPYMAPEMIQSLQDADKPADVWAIGAILYEFIAGKKPFGSGYKAVPLIQNAVPPPMPAAISSGLQYRPLGGDLHEIVLACLKKNPAERPTADQLVGMCERLCYSTAKRELGTVGNVPNNFFGFIEPDGGGRGVFFHNASIYGGGRLSTGDRVAFIRSPGEPKDRAFPLVKITA